MSQVRTQGWNKEIGYIWSMLGSAVGFANILSFSALCYKNGGGAFLIPYIFAHLLVGLPMLLLEGVIGQRTKLPLVGAMGQAAGGLGKALGWFSVITCATIGGFYIVLTGFAVAYTYFSATGSIGPDTAHFFKESFLHDSGGLSQWGGLAVGVFVATLVVVVFTWMVMSRNIQSGVEKLCSIFLPILAITVLFLTVVSIFLPGAIEGFKQYLVPDFSKLSSWTLWRDVFGQVFFSLSLGLGIVVGYSRHNPSTFNLRRAMLAVALGDFFISFTAGLAIFGSIGFMSFKTGTPFANLVHSDSAFEIGFIIFPMILAQFGELLARILGPLFFFCVFIAGITGVFSIIESVAGNIEVEFRKSRKKSVTLALILVTCFALPFCMGNGQHILGAMAPMVLGNAMIIGGMAEIVVLLFISRKIKQDIIWSARGAGKNYAFYSIRFFVLPLLMLSLLAALSNEFTHALGGAEIVRWSWFALAGVGSLLLACLMPKAPVQERVVKKEWALEEV